MDKPSFCVLCFGKSLSIIDNDSFRVLCFGLSIVDKAEIGGSSYSPKEGLLKSTKVTPVETRRCN